MDGCVFVEESLLRWYGGYCDQLDFWVDWDLGFDIAIFAVRQILSLVGYSSHLGVEWDFSKHSEVGVLNNVVGLAEVQLVSEGVVCSWILPFVCNQKFGGSGEYNVHTHHLECKGS
jgi:hypothetical protein